MTKTVDEWAAEQVGVGLREDNTIADGYLDNTNRIGLFTGDKWTIQDPRCREIVREHFELTTYYIKLNSGKNWTCQTDDKEPYGRGKTIAEAEIACITAIYEASQ